MFLAHSIVLRFNQFHRRGTRLWKGQTGLKQHRQPKSYR